MDNQYQYQHPPIDTFMNYTINLVKELIINEDINQLQEVVNKLNAISEDIDQFLPLIPQQLTDYRTLKQKYSQLQEEEQKVKERLEFYHTTMQQTPNTSQPIIQPINQPINQPITNINNYQQQENTNQQAPNTPQKNTNQNNITTTQPVPDINNFINEETTNTNEIDTNDFISPQEFFDEPSQETIEEPPSLSFDPFDELDNPQLLDNNPPNQNNPEPIIQEPETTNQEEENRPIDQPLQTEQNTNPLFDQKTLNTELENTNVNTTNIPEVGIPLKQIDQNETLSTERINTESLEDDITLLDEANTPQPEQPSQENITPQTNQTENNAPTLTDQTETIELVDDFF